MPPLDVIALGKQLGFDSAWLRHRHLQYGISSPLAVLAAASQRTSRIELGTAVIPLGWENPLPLAEDLATVDLLSGGRLNPGMSVGPPMNYDAVKQALYPGHDGHGGLHVRPGRTAPQAGPWRACCPQQHRGVRGVLRAGRAAQRGARPAPSGTAAPAMRSVQWAGEHGMSLLMSSVVKAESGSLDFAAIQLSHIEAFRAGNPDGRRARVSQGLVVIPTDSASAEQRTKYEAYVAARLPRTATPQGPGRLLFAPDLVGTSERVAF